MAARLIAIGCLLLHLLPPHFAGTGKTPAIVIFGDSSVDSGNNNFINTPAKCNYEPYGRDFEGGKPTGRFSNGRLATDFISQAFSLLPAVPAYLDPAYTIKDFAVAVCFASAATGYDNATSDVMVQNSVIPLWKELEFFKEYAAKLKSYQGEERANETIREALYIISMGANDFLENYYALPGRGRSSEFTAGEYESFLVGIAEGFVREVYGVGARKIDVTGLPPMGCLPLERAVENFRRPFAGGRCNEEYNGVAREFNGKLEKMVGKLSLELPEIRLVYGNIYDIFDDVIKNPTSYGFEVAEVGCCSNGLVEMGYMCRSPLTCWDANQYVFWDALHPTQKMNLLLASHTINTTLSSFM
ncbi:GDSL esterase/lipase [Apostasia shenzhenica]|uniref:GDSL esterase/lipase n=1 Tax=Apostasia shenzhenica TaxID=1088818 RepID=A0A2I0B716_9ASPA|nr:GDSL esterase/lipase [Apostasia shenzhenica]